MIIKIKVLSGENSQGWQSSEKKTLKGPRPNTCIAPEDAHSIDVQYHKSCWID
jgi:hypothetical protein